MSIRIVSEGMSSGVASQPSRRPVTAAHVAATQPRHVSAGAGNAGERSAFQRLIDGLGSEINRGERMMHGALAGGGRELAPSELLALQAGVYRYSEAVDLASKLVDRASSGVKTVVSGGQ